MDLEKLFGNGTATKCLLVIGRYDECATSEIAQAFGVPRAQVFLQLKKLEAAEILVSRMVSNVRLYSLNPRSGISKELKALLAKYITDQMPMEEYRDFYLLRRRPRAPGKKLGGAYAKAK